MKPYFQPFRQNAARFLIIFSLIFCLGLSVPQFANCENSVAEELISLDIKNQPLGEVLDVISDETGYQFSMDESWKEFPVTASLKNEPLHRGLKRILRNLNNAVIYGSDGIIRIKIYDRVNSSGQSAVNRSYEERIHQPVVSGNQGSRNTDAQSHNRSRTAPTDEQDSEESSESESEPDETDDKDDEATEESEPSDEEGASETATDSVAADNE